MPLIERRKSKASPQRRKNIRHAPDPGTFAQIDMSTKTPTFRPEYLGLVVEESYTGCGLVVVDMPKLKKGVKIRIQVGSVHPLKAEVKWRNDLDEQVARVGVQYLE